MADVANSQLYSSLNTLLSITEKSGNLRKDLKRDIVDSVSTLRNIFVNLNNSVELQMAKVGLLESEVKKLRRSFRFAEPVTYQHAPRHLGTGPGKLQRPACGTCCHRPAKLTNLMLKWRARVAKNDTS